MKDNDQQLIFEAYITETKGGRYDSSSGHAVEDALYAIEMAKMMDFDDWYNRVVVGATFTDILDLSSIINLYAGNMSRSRGQLGPSGSPRRTVGPMQAAQDLLNKIVRYHNPLGLNPGKGRRRVEDTPEFAEKYNKAEYDEYDRMYREAWKKMIEARRNEDVTGMVEWERKRDEYARLRSETDFQKARSAASQEEDQRVKQLQGTPFTRDTWDNLSPEAQQEIKSSYSTVQEAHRESN